MIYVLKAAFRKSDPSIQVRIPRKSYATCTVLQMAVIFKVFSQGLGEEEGIP